MAEDPGFPSGLSRCGAWLVGDLERVGTSSSSERKLVSASASLSPRQGVGVIYLFLPSRTSSGSGLQDTRRQGLPAEHAVLLEYPRNRKSPRLAIVPSCCCAMSTVDSAVLVPSWGQMSSRCWLVAPAGEPWHPVTWSGGDGSVSKETCRLASTPDSPGILLAAAMIRKWNPLLACSTI